MGCFATFISLILILRAGPYIFIAISIFLRVTISIFFIIQIQSVLYFLYSYLSFTAASINQKPSFESFFNDLSLTFLFGLFFIQVF